MPENQKRGSWNFEGFFQRPPEPTIDEKQAYSLQRILYRTPAVPPAPTQEKESLFTEEESRGMFIIGDKKFSIKHYLLTPVEFSQRPVFRRHGISPAATRLSLTRYSTVFERALVKTYPDSSFGSRYRVPAKLALDDTKSVIVPSLSTSDFKHYDQAHQTLLFFPHAETANALYQINNLDLEQIIGAGIIYPDKEGTYKIYEVLPRLKIV